MNIKVITYALVARVRVYVFWPTKQITYLGHKLFRTHWKLPTFSADGGRDEAGTNYRDPIMLHMFLSFSVVQINP